MTQPVNHCLLQNGPSIQLIDDAARIDFCKKLLEDPTFKGLLENARLPVDQITAISGSFIQDPLYPELSLKLHIGMQEVAIPLRLPKDEAEAHQFSNDPFFQTAMYLAGAREAPPALPLQQPPAPPTKDGTKEKDDDAGVVDGKGKKKKRVHFEKQLEEFEGDDGAPKRRSGVRLQKLGSGPTSVEYPDSDSSDDDDDDGAEFTRNPLHSPSANGLNIEEMNDDDDDIPPPPPLGDPPPHQLMVAPQRNVFFYPAVILISMIAWRIISRILGLYAQ